LYNVDLKALFLCGRKTLVGEISRANLLLLQLMGIFILVVMEWFVMFIAFISFRSVKFQKFTGRLVIITVALLTQQHLGIVTGFQYTIVFSSK
jgi:hypothetical protein